ncbi:MAG: DedA family protein [Candidatus Micrarchaeota archaeon]|nr:DedA family protein [Candidatus Micrarchaeota archaeon]
MFPLLLLDLLNLTYGTITALISQYGYYAIFALMILEAAAFPVPSEVVLPAVGLLAAKGVINPEISFTAVILGGIIGMAVDYYIAYFLGKEVVYKHLSFFHIKRRNLDSFDNWFAKNGSFAVFITRLIPLVRALINFPAGFAEMPIGRFLLYSIAGTLIWDALLISFGYYALSLSNFYYVVAAIIAFALVLYLVYYFAMKRIGRKR